MLGKVLHVALGRWFSLKGDHDSRCSVVFHVDAALPNDSTELDRFSALLANKYRLLAAASKQVTVSISIGCVQSDSTFSLIVLLRTLKRCIMWVMSAFGADVDYIENFFLNIT